MSATTMIRQRMSKVWLNMHAARARALLMTVEGVVCGGRLGLTATGRRLRSNTSPRHDIKRVDRLLGNPRLHQELPQVYAGLVRMVIGDNTRPAIHVDWTDVRSGRVALVAAMPAYGRSIPIYAEVHTLDVLGSPAVEQSFLRTLHDAIIPLWCRPVVVTDAGFRNDWFRAVSDMGWDYVGRLSSNPLALDLGSDEAVLAKSWVTVKELHSVATAKPKDLGRWAVAKSNPVVSRIVAFKGKPKGRKGSTKVNGRGVHPGSTAYKKYQQRGREPWMLATSLEGSPNSVVQYYATRMRIEESFRDAKNHRFGWSFEDARCRLPRPASTRGAAAYNAKGSRRLEVMLLIAALGMLIANLIGLALEQAGRHRDFQANSVTSRRVLSHFFLGSTALLSRSAGAAPPKSLALKRALTTLRSAIGNPQLLGVTVN